MKTLRQEILTFQKENKRQCDDAAQRAAVQIVCGIDLMATLRADTTARAAALLRVERLARRERAKGLAGHWSYDLNRHIALKQAGERLRNMNQSGI